MTSFFIVLLLITVCSAIAAHVIGWLREHRADVSELPPLLLPMADGLTREPDLSDTLVAPVEPAARHPQVAASATPAPPAENATDALDDPIDAVAETIRLTHLTEDALQLLPARLEVLAGMTGGQDIRFVRTPGKSPHMILGRAPGPSPHHVTLTSSTVSRRHARVTYADGEWKVINLSKTNPVVVNDHALPGPRSERTLFDGDKIELGDVVLRFRAS